MESDSAAITAIPPPPLGVVGSNTASMAVSPQLISSLIHVLKLLVMLYFEQRRTGLDSPRP
jgi:hypothetical protein